MMESGSHDDRSSAARWRAVSSRDRAADGLFWYGVVTTGIYCRPHCPSRPRAENVRFFATRAAARAAGLRACRRCHPDRD
jgi:AraC family transcriptional regulator, regulatory protein of adaptative response / methylated-DNA-[protein]-cysteine methyltransferase